jgi:hypothetical protein
MAVADGRIVLTYNSAERSWQAPIKWVTLSLGVSASPVKVRILRRRVVPGRSGDQMSQSAPELRSSRQTPRRYGFLVGAAVAASLLAGVVTAAFSPAMVTSTALVALPATTLTSAAAAPIADSYPVLAGALPGLSPGTSLGTVRGEVRVTSPRADVLSVSARAGTAAQAEATANAVAESYIGYAGSDGLPAGHIPAVMLSPATSASGAAGLTRLLVGALLGLASGLLIGVIAALGYRRLVLTG